MPLDDDGPLPQGLADALAAGSAAFVTTLRAQNPTGAVASPARLDELRRVLGEHPEVVVVEDDHAGPVAGAPGVTLAGDARARWAHVRSVSKWLGPDLRLAMLTGDAGDRGPRAGPSARRHGLGQPPAPGARGRHVVGPRRGGAAGAGTGDLPPATEELARRLEARGIEAHARSGMNAWVPVPDEGAVTRRLLDAGWAVLPGERFRLRSQPAIRVTVSTLDVTEADRLAGDIEAAMAPRRRTRLA